MAPVPPVPIPLNLPKLLAPLHGSFNKAIALRMRSMKKELPTSDAAANGNQSLSTSSSGNVRSLVATAFIPKGSVLTTIPAAHSLSGATSHSIVQQSFGSRRYRALLDFAAKREQHKDSSTASDGANGKVGYNKRADESFVAMSTRNCLLMLCALVAARAFTTEQTRLAKLKAKKPSPTAPPITSSPTNIFKELNMSAPPPSWLLHWTKYGLPTKHFASGIAVAEAQKVRVEPLVRRRLNVIEDASNMGFFPSTVPPAGYLGPSVVETLMDGEMLSLEGGQVREEMARRMPALEQGGLRTGGAETLLAAGGGHPVPLLEVGPADDSLVPAQKDMPVPLQQGMEETSVEPFSPNRTKDLIEVVATTHMVTAFMKDQPLALSENKQRMLAAHNYGVAEGFAELALRSAALDKQVLKPIAAILLDSHRKSLGKDREGNVSEDEDDDDIDDGLVMDDLRWAHAMLRSRSVNASWNSIGAAEADSAVGRSLVDPALIPTVDLLNHSHFTTANVTFVPTMNSSQQSSSVPSTFPSSSTSYSLVASRDIQEGDMLTCSYSHYRQRGILFSEDPQKAAEELSTGSQAAAALAASPSSASKNGTAIDLSSVPIAARERLAVAADMKRIENLQRWGGSGTTGGANGKEEDEDEGLSDSKRLMSDPRHARNRLDESVTEKYFKSNGADGEDSSTTRGAPVRDHAAVAQRKFAGISDADWSWYFGFAKSDDEKAVEAKRVYDKDLLRRVANMTDVRRKGHKGEFVVGVPPGLRNLNEHRAKLQESHYGGYTVFPPQRV